MTWTASARVSASGVRVLQGELTGGERDLEAPRRAFLEEGMLKGSFVPEPEIRLQLFVPSSPWLGEPSVREQRILKSKGCRPRKPVTLFLQLKNQA